MPVEIKELHIRVTVNPSAGGQTTPSAPTPSAANKDALIAECVEQVLNILKQKGER